MPSKLLAAAFLKLFFFSQSRSYISSFNLEFNQGAGLFLTRMTLVGACLSLNYIQEYIFPCIPRTIHFHTAFNNRPWGIFQIC